LVVITTGVSRLISGVLQEPLLRTRASLEKKMSA
jgi:hypothetical protein